MVLAPCPPTPNCVCSQSLEPLHQIAPLTFTSTPDPALAKLKNIIQPVPKTKMIRETKDYLHVEFKSTLMGFVDDLEFYLDRNPNVIHARSASHLAYSDLGVNRQRITEIRHRFIY